MKRPPHVKLISLGDTKTGKSCLIKRFCEKRFVPKYLQTIGIDYGTTVVKTPEKNNLKLHIFDTGGHRCFQQIREEFYENTQAILLTFSMADKNSYLNIHKYWLPEIKKNLEFEIDHIVFVICGTHSDSSQLEVNSDEARLWVERHPGWKYFETSSQSGENVQACFEYIFTELYNMLENDCKRDIIPPDYSDDQIKLVQKILKSRDNWARLGLHPSASKEDINKNYKHYAKLIHPDKCSVPGHEEAFKELATARNALVRLFK